MLRALAARTASEFKTMHSSLRAMGELLLIAAGQGRPVLGELEEIQQASKRVGAIAGQLLAFSGGIALQPQAVAFNDLVESILPRLRQLLGPGIEVIADLSANMEPVFVDPAQVRQIILKLASNSKEAMGSTGTFCLQTGNAIAVEPGLGSAEATGGRFGLLALSDSGPGLDDPSWAHLYEPFFSTKANGRSLGLGLAGVYGIVRQSGGRLWAYSQPGKGATFRIYLPLADAVFPALPESPIDNPRGGATILLVESNDGMRTVMSNLLKRRGFRVLPALHSTEALRIAAAQGPPDLLISRPEPELVLELARMHPPLRVLYLGGYSDGLVAQEQGLPPRTSLLQKPFEPETLLARVAEALFEPL
jgi:CheY-like chemotaxis protein